VAEETVFRSLDIDAQVPSRQLVSGDRELFSLKPAQHHDASSS
jgi:hypothetical protein